MKRGRVSKAVAVACGVAGAGGPACAYDLMGTQWNAAEMPVPYVVNHTLSGDVSDADALAAVQMGYEAWNALPCSSMRWTFAGRTANTGWGADDGENVVTFREDWWDDSGDALAITMTMWGGFADDLIDADIKFNGVHHRWAHFAGPPAGGSDATDIAAVATHEVGHALGLNHSGVPDATMWPSASSGDIGPRSLSADDIAGACAVYPTGSPAPDPDELPPPAPPTPERAAFGEDCASLTCEAELLCVSDGAAAYCSRRCLDALDCGAGYWCAPLADGSGACARGEDTRPPVAGIGEPCGHDRACTAGLVCLSDGREVYCAAACEFGACPAGFVCDALADGREACVRESVGLPALGAPCDPQGRCARGLICLSDRGSRYCTRACGDDDCGSAATCVDIEPDGRACRLANPPAGRTPVDPDPGASGALDGAGPLFGAPCRFAPGLPACATGLACVDTLVLDGVLVEPGYCTSGCDATHCCPGGWGCTADVGGRGRCRSEAFDDPGLECSGAAAGGDGPAPEPPAAPTAPAGGEAAAAREDDGFHCAAGLTPFLYALLGLGGLRRRRRG